MSSLQGKSNDLIERIRSNDYLKPIWGELNQMMKPEIYVGRSMQIVEQYCGPNGPVDKALAPYQKYIPGSATPEMNI
jgi:adenylosuccinate lyase